MIKKYSESKQSVAGKNFKYSIDSCNPLISTSLRDLSKQYQDLSREIANSEDLNKDDISEIIQATNSDKKWKTRLLIEPWEVQTN